MSSIHRALTLITPAVLMISRTFAGNIGETNPYFPETGRGAVYQRSIDLAGGEVVLVIAPEPGCEDLAGLAYLRMARGAQVVTAYVTNGDGTPSDYNGEAPFLLAARRKEEAYKVNTYLGCESYYLNLPDPGVVNDGAVLKRAWQPDSAVARITRIILSRRPDVIVIENDFWDQSSRSVKDDVLAEFVTTAVEKAKREPGPSTWSVQRVFRESISVVRGVRLDVRIVHPVWKKSYEAIGLSAAPLYESLRSLLSSHSLHAKHEYALIWPANAKAPSSLLGGVKAGGARVERLGGLIRGAVRGSSAFSPGLAGVSALIDSVDYILSHQVAALTNQEKRRVVSWKLGLESLRCALLDVDIRYVVTDSLLSEHQIFYVRFSTFKSKTGKNDAEIFFPGATQHEWSVNESLLDHFPFAAPKEFLILTPEKMDYNMPVSLYGLSATSLRTVFTFFIYRQGSDRSRNFSYKAEIPIRSGPRRTFEVLTPMVRAVNGEPIICALLNFSRDPFKGYITLADSLLGNVKKQVFLPSKDFLLFDTLRLELKRPVQTGDIVASVQLSGKGGIRPFIARSFTVEKDSSMQIRLVTGIGRSPVSDALHRIGIPASTVSGTFWDAELPGFQGVLLIDRDAMTLRSDVIPALPRIRSWVEGGGSLVVLPQFSVEGGIKLIDGLDFRSDLALPPTAEVSVDSTDVLLRTPNKLPDDDWGGWVVARSRGALRVAEAVNADIPVRARDSGDPLIATVAVGKGRITFVALDVSSQLMNIHPGAHRLLANLLGLK